MGDLLKDGLAWLTGQLQAHAAQTVTYRRGTNTVVVQATYGAKLLKLSDEFGVHLEWTDLDFCIPAEDLVLNGARITPQRGDEVLITVGGADAYDTESVERFEVFPFGSTEAPWRWADPHRSMIRVHTKHIGSEPYA